MLRVVIDTSVIVAGLRSVTGASNSVLRRVALRELVPLVTPALFLEYEDVLKRPEQRLVHGRSIEKIDHFLAALASASISVEIRFQWRPQMSDPSDEMVLETAINGRADVLVTHNMRDFEAAAARFGLRVLRPGELLAEMKW